jgi:hypothetical protein
MAQAVSCRPLTAEVWVRARVTPCSICVGQSGTATGFSASSLVSPVSIIPPGLHTHVSSGDGLWARWWPQFRDTVLFRRYKQHEYVALYALCIFSPNFNSIIIYKE